MAITRSAYLEAIRGMLIRTYQAEGFSAFTPLLRGAVEYVKVGGTAQVRADRREALRAMLTTLWGSDHAQHEAHMLRHVLAEAGVADEDAEDVPETAEPQV